MSYRAAFRAIAALGAVEQLTPEVVLHIGETTTLLRKTIFFKRATPEDSWRRMTELLALATKLGAPCDVLITVLRAENQELIDPPPKLLDLVVECMMLRPAAHDSPALALLVAAFGAGDTMIALDTQDVIRPLFIGYPEQRAQLWRNSPFVDEAVSEELRTVLLEHLDEVREQLTAIAQSDESTPEDLCWLVSLCPCQETIELLMSRFSRFDDLSRKQLAYALLMLLPEFGRQIALAAEKHHRVVSWILINSSDDSYLRLLVFRLISEFQELQVDSVRWHAELRLLVAEMQSKEEVRFTRWLEARGIGALRPTYRH